MILYLVAGLAIVCALAGLVKAMRESPADRSRTYPCGSFERAASEKAS